MASIIRFYMDECVRGAITRGLRRRGLDVLTAQEDGRDNTPDPIVLDRATELGRLIYTEDDDFLAEAAHRQSLHIPFIGVVYAHPQDVTIGQSVQDLEIIASFSVLEDYANRVEFLPLR